MANIKTTLAQRLVFAGMFTERENSVNLIRTVCMVCGGSEEYGTLRGGSAHF